MKANERWLIVLSLAISLIFVTALFSSCSSQEPGVQPPAATSMLKGVSLSPKSFQEADFNEFFEKAKEAGNIVSWAGDWSELGGTAGAPMVVVELAKKYKYTPVIEAQFFDQSTGALLRPLDEVTRRGYKEAAVSFAQKYKPAYFAFGIEVNILYEEAPVAFDLFVPFYAEVYDAMKAVSPNTKVFTIFQLEKMKGLSGGLFGGENNPNKAQWHLLNKFSKSDIIAFTTYPGLIYKNPSDIPLDYYAEIKSQTSKSIAFTEIGWHSLGIPAGWESSEAEQAEFVSKIFQLTAGLDREMVIWSFLYDQATIEPFASMGLRQKDGAAKLSWEEWLKAK